ncbi:peptide/nickel transport system permease protein [Nakamurella sp. UYEF19]|uniref:ABC transporter permease n=1 Tax=Nakamurella sp. UYEF19 TaxID=1756392 RepID=UPI00339955B3
MTVSGIVPGGLGDHAPGTAGEVAVPPGGDGAAGVGQGGSPWLLAWHRFRRNRSAMTASILFAVVVLACIMAPFYARYVAHTEPFTSNLTGTTPIDGQQVPVIEPNASGLGSTPIGPTWTGRYLFGADTQGRDVAARLLYGGRTSLIVGIGAALITAVIATIVALIAGFAGGWVDAVISRILDLVWAFPVYLLAISLSTVLLLQGLKIGPITVDPASLWLPVLIISLVYVPYLARPVRGEVLALRRREFVEAAIGQGISRSRVIFGELLPNVVPTVIVFLPLMIATDILTESSLSYLSIGVQAPNASWGSMITDGQSQLYTRPLVSIAPGVLLVLTIVLLNIVGDGVRDAIDPRGLLPRRERRFRRRPGRQTPARVS